jgi:predicted enzyme related to lactoylglutathione lyase
VLREPDDVGDSGRTALCADLDGAEFCLWQPDQHRGAAVVNEAGALNFNNLHAHDLSRAAGFYGAVFGWEILDIGAGSAWALPGYGDFLESRNPGMREGMASMGAPERFEDVVASVVQGTPAHWGVTFGADDADAIASRATELGGSVIAPPVDAPWSRTTVISDPQGAVFTASQFVPENKDVPAAASAA